MVDITGEDFSLRRIMAIETKMESLGPVGFNVFGLELVQFVLTFYITFA